jgi:hypothetical protein
MKLWFEGRNVNARERFLHYGRNLRRPASPR